MSGEVNLPNKVVFNSKFPTMNKDGLDAYSSITSQLTTDYGKDIPKKE